MKILWITWKDKHHPEAGGAEVVAHEICSRLTADGHDVTMLTSGYRGAKGVSPTPGVRVLRVGSSRYAHPFLALFYYMARLRNKFDIVIEEVNGGAPYFAVFFGRKARRFMLYHQLARKNWFYEIPKPFSHLGYYVLVPFATRLVSLAKTPLITISESTRQELAKFGFSPKRTKIISEGVHIKPLKKLEMVKKFDRPTLLSHGGLRAMKRTIDQVKAFEIAKKSIPDLQLKISGGAFGRYGKKVVDYIAQSPYKDDIEYLGRTTDQQKRELMQRCHAILVTSVEEGWGLIVTETNSQGTPAVVYDVHGLRDSVRHTETGIVTAENPSALARGISQLLKDRKSYESMRRKGWEWSKTMTFDRSYEDFKKVIGMSS